MLQGVLIRINSNYQGAIDKLNDDIKPKMDRCMGGNPDDDYITDCPAQNKLIEAINEVIVELNKLAKPCANVSPIWYVDAAAEVGGDGRSWGDALNNIQDAVNAALPGEQVWVRMGTYTSGSTDPVITMKDGVEIYGGFDETETDPTDRYLDTNETTLDGGDISYHVVVGASNARLDGFIVTRGNAIGYDDYDNGGGMYNGGVANLVVSNCIFSENSALYSGGGLFNYSSSATINSCTFSGNSAGNYGGGVFNSSSSITIADCVFDGNIAPYRGGGMYNLSSSPAITNCIFRYNEATGGPSANERGGGMFNNGSSPTITDCIFDNNLASQMGGGIYNFESSPTITNCTFNGNSVGFYGGGMYNEGSSPTIANCDFVDNSAYDGGGINNGWQSTPTITNCTFSVNSAERYGGGMYNAWPSPTITNCT
ncbi:MAG: hypothetical protein JSU92_04905, partial [Deltaproteobacteria bacterium]